MVSSWNSFNSETGTNIYFAPFVAYSLVLKEKLLNNYQAVFKLLIFFFTLKVW